MIHRLALAAAILFTAGQPLHSEDFVVRAALPVCTSKNFLGPFTIDVPTFWEPLKTDGALPNSWEHLLFAAILPYDKRPSAHEKNGPRLIWLYARAKMRISIYEPKLFEDENNRDQTALQALAKSKASLYREDIRRESGMTVTAQKEIINDVSVISVKKSCDKTPDINGPTGEQFIFEVSEEIIFVTGDKEFHIELTYCRADQEPIINEIRQSLRLTRRD
jgi:hypothetical protein